MILKNSSVLYLSDFDGTLCGDSKWYSLIKNTVNCIKKGPYLNLTDYDIRWSILTGRPKIDKWIIRLICIYHGLIPEKIFTSPGWKYNYKNDTQNHLDKLKTMFDIMDGVIKLNGKETISRIFYIDNDIECVKFINSNRKNYRILAVSVTDFYKQEFLSILI
jgi:hypothetical protein